MFTTITTTIPTEILGEVEKHVARLNRLGAKFNGNVGFAVVVDESSRRMEAAVRLDTVRLDTPAYHYEVEVIDISVSGTDTFAVDGWTFIGTVGKDGVITGEVDQSLWHIDTQRCDDCNYAHNRKQVFILQNEAGETKVVGGDCVKKYTGLLTPQQMVDLIEWQVTFADYSAKVYDPDKLRRTEPLYAIESFLAYVVADVAKRGYVSRQRGIEEEKATTTFAAFFAFRNEDYDDYIAAKAAEGEAKKILAWGRETFTQATATTSYEQSLAILLASDHFTHKRAGFIASLVASYHKAMAKPKIKVEATHLWNVGDTVDVTGTVRTAITIEGFYGNTYLSILDVNGQTVKMFAGKRLNEGQTYTFTKAEVIEHSEYKGRPETIIKVNFRLKVNREAADAPAVNS